jgi:hypothetical protein
MIPVGTATGGNDISPQSWPVRMDKTVVTLRARTDKHLWNRLCLPKLMARTKAAVPNSPPTLDINMAVDDQGGAQ